MRARFVLLGAALALGLTACGGSGDDAKTAKAATEVKVGKTALGAVLTDGTGRTLYGFTPDKEGQSTCVDACVATWPALASKDQPGAGDGVQTGLLKRIQRGEGTFQASYGNWPLYYYAGDQRPGDAEGQGVDGQWFVVGADGKLIKNQG
ncbi:hypothetical protein ACGFNU_22085 [Spirillospora sp. NPDC048911]|uniref:COG4315 family predicted lipoprotein n=1 Tax=Spirillospora sp. NPDC048911 TaxID=3364527 RepID=UPI0037116573